MEVFHGTDNISMENILKNGIILSKCNDSTDNFKGFYTTPDFEFAKKRAEQIVLKQKINNRGIKPVVIKFDFLENEIGSDISVKRFDAVCTEWKYFVVINRIGKTSFIKNSEAFSGYNHNLDLTYDLVYDPTADAGISSIVSNIKFSKKHFNADDVLQMINSVDIGFQPVWGNQISFHSDKAFELLKIISAEEV